MAISIMIADDHAIFRSGLRAMIEKERDLKVVAETGNGADTIAEIKKHKVDVLILDLKMPGMPGDKLAETILKKYPELPIVILTMHEDEYYLKELLKIGVRAYILKQSTFTDLLQAIRAVHKGGFYVDPALSGTLVQGVFADPNLKKKISGRNESLSNREREICSLLAYGFTNAEIAAKLCISIRTVEGHRTHMIDKLAIKSRAELVRYALRSGLLK